jgi:hypothetical protein
MQGAAVACESRSPGSTAGRAGPPEFKAVSHDGVPAFVRKIVIKSFHGAHINIIDPAAAYTSNVIVQVSGAVKSFLAASNFDFLHYALPAKPFQVAVYGCKAHPGQAAAHLLIKLISRGMGFHGPQFMQDNFTLMGDSKFIYHNTSY